MYFYSYFRAGTSGLYLPSNFGKRFLRSESGLYLPNSPTATQEWIIGLHLTAITCSRRVICSGDLVFRTYVELIVSHFFKLRFEPDFLAPDPSERLGEDKLSSFYAELNLWMKVYDLLELIYPEMTPIKPYEALLQLSMDCNGIILPWTFSDPESPISSKLVKKIQSQNAQLKVYDNPFPQGSISHHFCDLFIGIGSSYAHKKYQVFVQARGKLAQAMRMIGVSTFTWNSQSNEWQEVIARNNPAQREKNKKRTRRRKVNQGKG